MAPSFIIIFLSKKKKEKRIELKSLIMWDMSWIEWLGPNINGWCLSFIKSMGVYNAKSQENQFIISPLKNQTIYTETCHQTLPLTVTIAPPLPNSFIPTPYLSKTNLYRASPTPPLTVQIPSFFLPNIPIIPP